MPRAHILNDRAAGARQSCVVINGAEAIGGSIVTFKDVRVRAICFRLESFVQICRVGRFRIYSVTAMARCTGLKPRNTGSAIAGGMPFDAVIARRRSVHALTV